MAYIEVQNIEDYISIIYFNNPETKNSMTLEMGKEFQQALKQLQHSHTRVAIITGKNNIFSSGGDFNLLKSFILKTQEENQKFMQYFYHLFLEVRNCSFPIIAAVNGHAIGASFALALACDLRYFIPDGKYAFNFVKLGIHPGMGSTFLIQEIANLTQAQELLFTGKIITGEEAYKRGLCHNIFSREQMLSEVIQIAREIAQNAPLAIQELKKNLYSVHNLEDALQKEAKSQANHFKTNDFREAIQSIEQKRKPHFKGN